jgi:hypothetical protein
VPLKVEGLKVVTRVATTDGPVVNKPFKIKLAFNYMGNDVSKIEISDKVTIEENRGWSPAFDIGSVIFPNYGEYDVSLYINDKKLITRRLYVKNERELSEP